MTGLNPAVDAVAPTARRPRVALKLRQDRSRATTRGWRVTPWLFLAVPLVFLVVFTYIPVVNMFWYCVTDWNGLSKTKNFVGLHNYVTFFTRPELFRVFLVSLYYVVGAVVQIALALYFATILSFDTRFKNLFKGDPLLPLPDQRRRDRRSSSSTSSAPAARSTRCSNGVGIGSTPQWLGNPDIVNFSLASTSVWRYMGLNFVLFLGAIQSIPSEHLRGRRARRRQPLAQFRYIIVPGIQPIISLSFILAIAGSLGVFEIPFIMLDGANGSATFVIQTDQDGLQLPQGRPRLGDGRDPARPDPAGHLDATRARARRQGGPGVTATPLGTATGEVHQPAVVGVRRVAPAIPLVRHSC